MKAKLKTCVACEKEKPIWKNHEGNKYCQYCWNKRQATEPAKRNTYVKKGASKIVKLEKEYTQLRKIYLTKHPLCMAALPGCQHNATDVHHKKGRGKWYLVVAKWMAVCRKCHIWIEEHPIEATDLGFRESKITD
jgi:hypothetical protein